MLEPPVTQTEEVKKTSLSKPIVNRETPVSVLYKTDIVYRGLVEILILEPSWHRDPNNGVKGTI